MVMAGRTECGFLTVSEPANRAQASKHCSVVTTIGRWRFKPLRVRALAVADDYKTA